MNEAFWIPGGHRYSGGDSTGASLQIFHLEKTVKFSPFSAAEDSVPGTPTSPTGSHTSMALSINSGNAVPIARTEKHVVLAMSPARPKVSSMQAKLDHTKIDTSLYDQVSWPKYTRKRTQTHDIETSQILTSGIINARKLIDFSAGEIETKSIGAGKHTRRRACHRLLWSKCWNIDRSIDWGGVSFHFVFSIFFHLRFIVLSTHSLALIHFPRQANDLQPRDFSGTADPYAKIRLLPDRMNFWQTKIHKKTLNPSESSFHVQFISAAINFLLKSICHFLCPSLSFVSQFLMKTSCSKRNRLSLDVEPLKFYYTISIRIRVTFVSAAPKSISPNWIWHTRMIYGIICRCVRNKTTKSTWAN